MRTTIDIDSAVLDKLRERARREGKTAGGLASELLVVALQDEALIEPPPIVWLSRPMGVLVDLEDPDAVRRTMKAPIAEGHCTS
jgi:hypothetical protein